MPISQLQPTPQEEVENAIDADNAKAAEPELSEQTSASAQESAPQSEGQFAIPKVEGREHRITQPKPTVYIGNLFFDVTEDDLSRELSRFGKIKKLRLLRDSRGLSKGSVSIPHQVALC